MSVGGTGRIDAMPDFPTDYPHGRALSRFRCRDAANRHSMRYGAGMNTREIEISHTTLVAETEATGKRPRRGAVRDRRKLLLDGATELFTIRNYSAVSIKLISATTGINTALIYYYYGSKEGLFRAVVEDLTEKAYQTFDDIKGKSTSPSEIIALWIGNQAAQLPLMRKLFMIGIDYANAHSRSDEVDSAIRRLYEIEADILGSAIREGIRRAEFKVVDVGQTIDQISAFLDGALAHAAMMPNFDAAGAIMVFRDNLLSGLKRVDQP